MSLVHTQALVLRDTDFGEHSQILDLFTLSHGRISAIAKGVRRQRRFNAFEQSFEIGQRWDVVFYEKKQGLAPLSEGQMLNGHFNIRANLKSLHALYAVVELLREFAPLGESKVPMFEAACRCLEGLPKQDHPFRAMIGFCAALVMDGGFRPRLSRCVLCGRQRQGGHPCPIHPVKGGAICPLCRRREDEVFMLDPEVVEALEVLFRDHQLPDTPKMLDRVDHILKLWITHHLGYHLKCLSLS